MGAPFLFPSPRVGEEREAPLLLPRAGPLAEAAAAGDAVRAVAADHRAAGGPDAGGGHLRLLRRPLADGDASPVGRAGRRHRLGRGELQGRSRPREFRPPLAARGRVPGPLHRPAARPPARQAARPAADHRALLRAHRPFSGSRPVGTAGRPVLVRHHPLPGLRRHPGGRAGGGDAGIGPARAGLRHPGAHLRPVDGRGHGDADRRGDPLHPQPGARHRGACQRRRSVRTRRRRAGLQAARRPRGPTRGHRLPRHARASSVTSNSARPCSPR